VTISGFTSGSNSGGSGKTGVGGGEYCARKQRQLERYVYTAKQVRKLNVESLLLEGELGNGLLSTVSVSVSICGSGSGLWGRGCRRLRNSSLSELGLDPGNSLFKLGRLQRNTQIVNVNIPSTLSARILGPDQCVRSALGAFASELPTPRELLASPSSSFGDGFIGALGDVHVSHRELLAFLEVAEGDKGEFGCAGFVE